MINHNLLSIMSEGWEGAYATLQHHNNLLSVLSSSHASCEISASYYRIRCKEF